MVSLADAKQAAIDLPEVEEKSHFQRPDFRIRNRIFAVLHLDKNCMVIKLSVPDQSVFCAFDEKVIYPVSGGWGLKGWTMINLKKVKKAMFMDALATAWKTVAPPKLAAKYFPIA
ncbi:MAG: MmcQ/YjbR family DNA-binding protein [Chitinophagaceae bacterium]